jgi:Domain of unknown function (DUF4160)
MPTISRFLGIVIRMYYREHAPPHFHAFYRDHEAKISIQTLEIMSGSLPRRALSLVLEWAERRRQELEANWRLAEQRKRLRDIEPLE